jgi:hypothetical protein
MKKTSNGNIYSKVFLSIVAFTFFASVSIQAQSGYDFISVESNTLDLFLKKQWQSLEEYGKLALENGIDYYALRYRIGVAQYEQKKYWESARNFEAALDFNNADFWSLEYLYFAYLFTDRDESARALADKMPTELVDKIDIQKIKPLDFIYAEGGFKTSTLPDSVYGLNYVSVGIGQQLGYRLKLFHSISGLGLSEPEPDFRQLEYYLKGDWYLGNGYTLIPAVHLVSFDGVSLGALVSRPSTGEIYVKQKAWALHLGVRKYFGRFSFLPSFTQLSLKTDTGISTTSKLFELGFGTEYQVPIMKDRFTLGAATVLQESSSSSTLYWKASLQFKLASRLFIKAEYFEPNSTNFTETYASVFNNATSKLNNRTSLMATWFIGYKSALFLIFQNEKKAETNFSFNYRTFLAGLKYQL